jgi:hypothetical protein
MYTLSDAHGKPELESILQGLTAQHPKVVEQAEDAVGAKLVHCLLVANHERSIKLALELIEIHPPLLLGTHGQHSANKPVFTGEGSLHIVAVNKRGAAVETMVRTAVRHLRPEQIEELICQSCTGLFFKAAPTRYFGGSVMAYLSIFGLLIPVLPLLDELPEARKAALCMRGGKHEYTPLHATVVAGRMPEFDALIACGCDEFAEDRDGLTPMRLAVKMGMREMFLHTLRLRVKTEWVWGPIASYKLPLSGLDTEGDLGKQSVMELTADDSALDKTKEMLLDSFMNGFIFKLFIKKWNLWAKYLWLFQLMLDWCLVISVTLLASPSSLGRDGPQTDLKLQATICLVLVAITVEEQVRELISFLVLNRKNLAHAGSARKTLRDDFMYGRVDNWLLIISVIFVAASLIAADDPKEANKEPIVRVMIAIAASMAWLQVFLNSFVPFERFGVFVLLVNRMVFGDMTTWSVIVLPWLFGLGTAANAVAPGATEVPFVGEGGHSLAYWPYALESFFLMISNGITPVYRAYHYASSKVVDGDDDVGRLRQLRGGRGGGSTRVIGVLSDEPEETDYPSQLMLDDNYGEDLGVWFYVFYVVFCYVVLIMLLNLLIAMMGNTYTRALDQATLDWRGEFARLVLRLELSAFNTPISMLPGAAKRKVRVERLTKLGEVLQGEGEDSARYFSFQSFTASAGMELHGTLGDIFDEAEESANTEDIFADATKKQPEVQAGDKYVPITINVAGASPMYVPITLGELNAPEPLTPMEQVIREQDAIAHSLAALVAQAQALRAKTHRQAFEDVEEKKDVAALEAQVQELKAKNAEQELFITTLTKGKAETQMSVSMI